LIGAGFFGVLAKTVVEVVVVVFECGRAEAEAITGVQKPSVAAMPIATNNRIDDFFMHKGY
jgi:hypothetical protein